MRVRTQDGARLKRLAKAYADAWVEVVYIGGSDPADHDEIRERYKKARQRLHAEIDRLTGVDLTPRAVEDHY